VGLLFEGGFTVVAPLSVDLQGYGPEAGDGIGLREADLGELSRSGPFFRTSLVGRY
jgi:hypothetical protein